MMEYTHVNPRDYFKNTDKRIIEKIKEYLPEHLHKHGPKFIVNLINSPKQMSILYKLSRYSVVLPSRFLERHFDALYKLKALGIPALLECGIIARSNYQRASEEASGLCREYNADGEMVLNLMLYAHELGIPLQAKNVVNAVEDKFLKNPGTNHPDMGAASASATAANPIDIGVVLNPSSPLYSVMRHIFKDVIRIKDIDDYCVGRYKALLLRKNKMLLKNPKRYHSEVRSIYSDWCKYTSLLIRGINDNEGIFKYTKTFMVTSTGRLCETNGGLQGLSRGCKTYIYKDVENLNNYDIKASQITLLGHFCKKIGINTKWIDDYVNMDDAKNVYAHRVGISAVAWKKTILSMVFGGTDNTYGTPYQTILKDKGGNKRVAEQCFARWKAETEGLRIICKLWLKRIRKYAKDNSKNNILENAVGVQTNIKDISCNRKFLSSFLLQGLESRILSDLILYPNKTYEVVSPEFDGLVVIGEIPDNVWTDVLVANKLQNSNLTLEKKSFS